MATEIHQLCHAPVIDTEPTVEEIVVELRSMAITSAVVPDEFPVELLSHGQLHDPIALRKFQVTSRVWRKQKVPQK